MKFSGWRRVFYFLGLAIALPLFGRQIWLSLQSVRSGEIRLVQPAYLALALAFTLTMSFIQAVGWVWLMRSVGIRLSMRECLEGFFASFLPRYIPGSVWGYVSRGAWLEQAHGVPYRVSSLGSLMEMGLFVLTTALVTALGVALLRPQLRGAMALAALLLALATIVMLPRAQRWYLRRTGSEELPPAHRERGWLLAVAALFLAFWLIYGAAIVATVAAFGGGQPALIPASMAAGQSWVVGLVAIMVPAGLGVRETTLTGLLAGQGGLSVEAAAAAAVLSRFELLLAEIFWLLIGLTLVRMRRARARPA